MKDSFSSPRKPWRIITSIISAIIIVSIIAPFSAITAFALDIPQLIKPENYSTTTSDSYPPLGVPTFSWSAVADAKIYHIQVDSEVGFNAPIFLNFTTKNTTFTPSSTGNLFSDGQWYWRVRVEDPAPIGDWSQVFTFTKTWATPGNKPNLLAPENGTSLAFFDAPSFSWSTVMGAARYRFQIATTPGGFDSPFLSVSTIATAYQPNDRYTNGAYYWRVVPVDTAEHLGTPSEVRSFTAAYGESILQDMVPTMLTPVDESFPKFTPTFRWTAIKGAQQYRLEYTSDETCDFSVGTSIVTRQTSYTPTETFSNDFRYCWHVRVESGPAVGDWSADQNGNPWHFQKIWDLKPTLLTPTNLYQTGLYPLYSWTPVPGAARYNIQISQNTSFVPIYEESTTANTTYSPQSRYNGTSHYYWRVRPIDGNGKFGVFSEVFEFQSIYNSEAPILIYPLYYYQPNNYGEYTMNPYEDRTVAFPIFMWHRVMEPSPIGGVYATAYRIQVDETDDFDSPTWQYDTQNTSATPTVDQPFTPITGQDYYWRVCPLNSINDGSCLTNPDSGQPWWSQKWKTRFSTTLELPPTPGNVPVLLRPAVVQESVEATPLLEWWPMQGATQYQVEVSRDAEFSTSEITETVNIPAYSPTYGLAQRNLGLTDYGTFYWHVRGYSASGWSNTWSSTWRFQIASQSEWRYSRTIGDPVNRLLIGDDPIDTSPDFDLTTLYASQSDTSWYFGFNENPSTTDLTYVLYLDLDNIQNSGATYPPGSIYQVSTVPEHQPEFAIYVNQVGGVINAQNTLVYGWSGSAWGSGQRFSEIGGAVYSSGGYVELEVPYGAIGMSQQTNSMSLMLFNVNIANNQVQDSVPSDPEVPGTAVLSRFSAVSERMNLVYPPNTTAGDPSIITSMLPFFWDWPTGSYPSTPFAGSILQVDVDQNYTPPHEATFQINSDTAYFGENNVTMLQDIIGDNIYYWRVQPRYNLEGHSPAFGAWTGGWSFRRLGFVPEGLYTSAVPAMLSFGWDLAEGAEQYRLQVATDPNFSNRVININTRMNTYSPPNLIPEDLYYWRVQIIRSGGIVNDWAEGQPFEFTLPTPNGLVPDAGVVIHYTPTYCWNPVVLLDGDNHPVFTAWKYQLQVSQDPSFSNIYDSISTNNQCWTPTKGYNDGSYWWRVAIIDGNGTMGPYSQAATFTKQYPITTLRSPIGVSATTPTFIWDPVNPAATYTFEVSLFSTFSPLYQSLDTINTHYTPSSIYQSDKIYYWRVAIRDRDGRQGPFTDARILIGLSNNIYLPMIRR